MLNYQEMWELMMRKLKETVQNMPEGSGQTQREYYKTKKSALREWYQTLVQIEKGVIIE